MAKLTSFTFTPGGTLVYRKSGQIAPEKYYVKGSSVYNSETGRRVGYARQWKNLTPSEQRKVESAEKSRTRQYRRRYQPWDKGKPRKPSGAKPRAPSKKAREPKVPPSEEYLEEYANLIRDYAMQLRDGPTKETLMSITLDECETLHALAYDVYEAFVQYGDKIMKGGESPHDRAVFERQGRRLAQLLKAIR